MSLRWDRLFCEVLQEPLQVSQFDWFVQVCIQQRLVVRSRFLPLISTDEYSLNDGIECPDFLDQFLPIETWKVKIGDNDIKRLLLRQIECQLGCHGRRDFIALSFEKMAQRPEKEIVVFNHQDFR